MSSRLHHTLTKRNESGLRKSLRTLSAYIYNKGALLAVVVGAFYAYTKIPDPGPEAGPLPFVEIAYAALTLLALVVSATALRLLVFGEAAEYAETGRLDDDLERDEFTPALVHYWFATGICYTISALCMATITK